MLRCVVTILVHRSVKYLAFEHVTFHFFSQHMYLLTSLSQMIPYRFNRTSRCCIFLLLVKTNHILQCLYALLPLHLFTMKRLRCLQG